MYFSYNSVEGCFPLLQAYFDLHHKRPRDFIVLQPVDELAHSSTRQIREQKIPYPRFNMDVHVAPVRFQSGAFEFISNAGFEPALTGVRNSFTSINHGVLSLLYYEQIISRWTEAVGQNRQEFLGEVQSKRDKPQRHKSIT